ncbi:hypothetical protein NLU13_7388 [Sarocladium strictum]|uniref:Uncharacterized protein n=1 Tax=Sarocladium strictum TaxID=5046 RepID=A0AA39GE74_SARSR|nr:hypothetical protein NLU13_7388 [Sarocladium strictum]
MCAWEEFLFICNHSVLRVQSRCHFARNDPQHRCYNVKQLKNTWLQDRPCKECTRSLRDGSSSATETTQ